MKKALILAKNILVWVVVVLAILMMVFTLISVNTFDRNDRSLFGFRMYTVLSDSMSKTDFSAGDVVVMREVDPKTLEVGDIISYMSQDSENFGKTITHKIREKVTDADGNPGFITYGTTTDTDDAMVVTYPYITGKYVFHIPHLGHFFQFLQSTVGYIVCIFIPFALLILYQGIKVVVLFRRYKKEQNAQIQQEKDQIAAEREANAKMLEELQALKAQLAGQIAAPAAETAAEAPVQTEPEVPAEQAEEQP